MSLETAPHQPAITLHNGSLSIGKHRLEALADGLFAIVMTLLVLELKVPELPHGASTAEVMHELSGMWRVLFSFVMTFSLAGLFWTRQQAILAATRTLDRFGALLHLTAMMFVTLLPFSTAMLGHYISSGFVMSLYFGNQTMVALLLCAAWFREKSLHNLSEVGEQAQSMITITSIAMVCALGGATIAAMIKPQYAFFGALPGAIIKRVSSRKARAAR